MSPRRLTASLALGLAIATFQLSAFSFQLSLPRPPVQDDPPPPREEITIGEETFRLEVAATPAARSRGLMGRKTVDADGGMLFIFPEPLRVRRFWMADCLVNIDLVFLDARGRVLAVHRMKTEPRRRGESRARYEDRLRRYSSVRPARFAIELKAGSISRLKLRRGDEIKLDLERLTALAR